MLFCLIAVFFGGAHLAYKGKESTAESIADSAHYESRLLTGTESVDPMQAATIANKSIEQTDDTPQSFELQLKEWMRRDAQGLVECTHADGGASVHLQGRFSHVTVALPTGDGGWVYRCFENHEELQAALNGSLPEDSEISTTNEVVYQ